jgi:S1-C subfamily serine protease
MPPGSGPLLGSWRTKILLAVGSAVVLLGGRAAIPPATPSAVPVSQERAAPLITQGDVNLGLDPVGAFVTIPAQQPDAAGRTVSDLAPAATPALAGIGVAVSERYVLTHAQTLGGRRSVTLVLAAGREAQAELAVHELETGLVLLKWTGGTPLRPLRFRTSDESRVRGIVDRLTALADAGRGLPASLGISIQPIDAELGAVVGTEGVLISAVEPGSPAAAVLRAGDALTAIDDTPVASIDAAREAFARLRVDAPATVTVRRNGKPLTVSVTAGQAQGPRKSTDDALDAPAAGDLLSRAQLDAAGIEAGARVLAVNGDPVRTRAAVQGQLRPRRPPALLYVQQDGERFFAVLR